MIFRSIDYLLWPFMWVLGGFVFPVQETHLWHVVKYNWKNNKGLTIEEKDNKAKFGHTSPFGLFHMPIFGGLTKYVVLEASKYNRYWNIGWKDHIHLLNIKQKRIAMLVGKDGFVAYGVDDLGKSIKLKVIGFGILGDSKYNGLRLF